MEPSTADILIVVDKDLFRIGSLCEISYLTACLSGNTLKQ